MKTALQAFLSATALLASTSVSAAPTGANYQRLPDIPTPDGRWDFVSWNAAHSRVIVANGSDILLANTTSPSSARTIGQIEGAYAAVAIPGGDRVRVSSAHDNIVRILDSASGNQLASIPAANDPDATVLSTEGHTAYVMGADGGAISVVDLNRQVELAHIAVKPGLEVPELFGSRVLAVNDEGIGEIRHVDLAAGKPVGTIPMPGCEGQTGIAYSPAYGLTLSACGNGKAALVDLQRRKLIRLLPIGLGPDTVIWDARCKHSLVTWGKSGTLSVIALGKSSASIAPTLPSEVSARTAALDLAIGRIFLPSAKFAPAPAGKRPDMAAGSFHFVVLSPNRN